MRKYWLTAAIPLAAITVAAAIGPIAASGATTTLTAKTAVTNRDDSAANTANNTNNGNWAMDTFTRGAQITFKGAAVAADCGGASPCYAYTGKVSDVGNFVTDGGQPSPGFGYLNGGNDPLMAVSAKGTLAGSQTYAFFTTVPVSGASASHVPPAESGNGVGSGEWLEQFFPAGTQFWDSTGAPQGVLGAGGQLGPHLHLHLRPEGWGGPQLSEHEQPVEGRQP